MMHARPLLLAASTLALLISACSQPADIQVPNLEPQFGSRFDDVGFDVAAVSDGRAFVLSREVGYNYDDYYDLEYETLHLRQYDSSGDFISETVLDSVACSWDYASCDVTRIKPLALYADAKGSGYALYLSRDNYDGPTLSYLVAKLDASGRKTIYTVGEGDIDPAKSLIGAAVDGSGNIYVAKVQYTYDYDTGTGTYTNVVAKHSNGALVWQRTSTVGRPYGIAVSDGGSVYVVGSKGLARYTNSGGLTWSRAADNSKGVLEKAGNIVVSGSYIYTRSGKDIRKYDGTGKQLWLRTQSGLNTIVVQDMDGDGSGNVYLSGKYEASAGNMNAFARKLSPSGSVLWTKGYGTPVYDDARGIATIGGSAIFTTGETQGSLAHRNRGGRDGYVRKLNSTGGLVWNR